MVKWIIVGVYVFVLFFFASSQSSGASVMTQAFRSWFPWLAREEVSNFVIIVRKTAHVIGYFVGEILIFRAVKETKVIKKRPFVFTFCFTVLIAGVDELYQHSLPHRTSSIYDVLLDSVGISVALLSIFVFNKLLERTKKAPSES